MTSAILNLCKQHLKVLKFIQFPRFLNWNRALTNISSNDLNTDACLGTKDKIYIKGNVIFLKHPILLIARVPKNLITINPF